MIGGDGGAVIVSVGKDDGGRTERHGVGVHAVVVHHYAANWVVVFIIINVDRIALREILGELVADLRYVITYFALYYKEVHEGNSYTYELTDKSKVLLPKLDHEFGECEWTWGRSTYDGGIMAILRMECKNCHRAISTVSYSDEITSEVTTEPGEYTEGERTYTVTQTHYGQTYTNTYTEPIPMTHAVAMIEQKSYSSLEAAFDDVEANEIVLLCEDVNNPDAECNNGRESFSFILDLGSHSATLGSIDMSGNLTVKNGTLRCIINNLNVGNDQTLTLDHAEVHCEEVSRYNELQELVSSMGLQWLAKNIVVTNGSQLYIVGNTYLGGNDGFNLDIDGTSCVVLENVTLNGYKL